MLITLISLLLVMFAISFVMSFFVNIDGMKNYRLNYQSGAKIICSPLITSIRGKLGNGIGQVWKGIQTMRQMPAVIANPNSNAQAEARSLIGLARAAWKALSDANKISWDEMALLIKDYELPPGGVRNLVPKLGGPMSGFNCYMSFYMAAVGAGCAAPTSAPLAEQRPGCPTAVGIAYVSPTLTVTWTDPTVVESGAYIRIWLRSDGGVYHKQLIDHVALAAETKDLAGARGALGGTIAFTIPEAAGEEMLRVQLDTVNPSGNRSLGSNTRYILIA